MAERVNNEKQYFYQIYENDKLIDSGTIDDPFVTTKIVPSGWLAAWKVFRGKLMFRVHVAGSREAHHVIFGGDYTPLPKSQRVIMSHAAEEARKKP